MRAQIWSGDFGTKQVEATANLYRNREKTSEAVMALMLLSADPVVFNSNGGALPTLGAISSEEFFFY